MGKDKLRDRPCTCIASVYSYKRLDSNPWRNILVYSPSNWIPLTRDIKEGDYKERTSRERKSLVVHSIPCACGLHSIYTYTSERWDAWRVVRDDIAETEEAEPLRKRLIDMPYHALSSRLRRNTNILLCTQWTIVRKLTEKELHSSCSFHLILGSYFQREEEPREN